MASCLSSCSEPTLYQFDPSLLVTSPLAPSSSLNCLTPSFIYSHDGPLQMDRRPSIPSATSSQPPLKPCHRSLRSRATSSEAGSEHSVRYSSISTHASPPPLPLSRSLHPVALPPLSSDPRSSSRSSFRSVSSIGSRLRLKLSKFRSPTYLALPSPPTLTWARLREEYELHLARDSIIERCLVQVTIEPENPVLARRWVDRVWRLADRLSPALPAALLQYPADGLLPLLIPLRQSLNSLSDLLPFKASPLQFTTLDAALSRASKFARLIEHVIEAVGRAGLVKFELVGDPEYWSGELRGRTGSGANWKGVIRQPK